MKKSTWITLLLMLAVPIVGFVAGTSGLRAWQAWNAPQTFRAGNFTAVVGSVGSPVVLLSTSTCPWCERSRDWLDARKVPYRDCVVDTDAFAADLLDRVGTGSVPQLLTSQAVVHGYAPEAFTLLLEGLTPDPSTTQPDDGALSVPPGIPPADGNRIDDLMALPARCDAPRWSRRPPGDDRDNAQSSAPFMDDASAQVVDISAAGLSGG